MTLMTNDEKLIKQAETIEIKRFKRHDKVKLTFPKGHDLKNVIWRLRCHIEEIPDHPLEDKILREAILKKVSSK